MKDSTSLTEQEKKTIEEILEKDFVGEAIKFIEYALEGKQKKKIKDKRIFVVGNYRVFVFGRGKSIKGKMHDLHLYDIMEIECEADIIAFKVRDSKTKQLVVQNYIQSQRMNELIREIRNSYQGISHHFPEDTKLKVMSTHNPSLDELNPSVANGYLDVYKAQCAYFSTPICAEFLFYVTNIVQSGSLELDISECPGIEPKSELSLNMVPVFAALRHNSYFRSIVISKVPRKEVISLLSDTLKYNRFITKLVFKDVGGEEKSFIELANVLKDYHNHSIQIINFSENAIGNKGFSALGEALAEWPHAILSLDLSNCKFHGKGLIIALEKHFAMSLTVEELNLSKNNIGKEGSPLLESWLSHVKSNSRLKKLSLASTGLVVQALPSLKLLGNLTELDLSGNKLDTFDSCKPIADFCEVSSNLRKINLRNASLTRESIESVIDTIAGNPKLNAVEVDLSNNDGLGARGVGVIANALKRSTNIIALDMSGVRMKDQNFIEFLEGASKCRNLKKLSISKVLSKNSVTAREKTTLGVVVALSVLITDATNLRVLNLSDGYGRTILYPFLQALAKNTSVVSIDISHNNLGDKGAEEISSLLRHNKSIREINFDDNKISTTGYRAINIAIAQNDAVAKVTYPVADVSKVPDDKQATFQSLVNNIIGKAFLNNARSPYESEEREASVVPVTVKGHAEVSDELKTVQSKNRGLTFDDVPEYTPPPPEPEKERGSIDQEEKEEEKEKEKEKENEKEEEDSASDSELSKSKQSVSSVAERSPSPPPDTPSRKTMTLPGPITEIPKTPSKEEKRKTIALSASLPRDKSGPTVTDAPPPPAPPPPPTSSAPPPPPPAPAVPKSSSDRNALMSGIRGFNATKLKKVETNDRSSPVLASASNPTSTGSTSKPPSSGNPMMAEMLAKRRKAIESND